MAASPLFDTVVTGRVTAVNEKGFRLDVSDGWLNFSKFAVNIAAPERGMQVSATLDKAGFVRAIAFADGSAPINGHATPGFDAQGRSAPSARDATITRLAVLKAAAEFGASRPELKSGDVLRIADSWAAWVTSPPKAVPAVDDLDPFDSQARSGQATAF